ncbi:uncharacterized protein CTHT_0040180 [Thermochaetoides thermophila DSM 1495]|uniref:Metallo-beta-lactamase domain-containing protein n=1 Tax=Chaetomium thermophilum (strain DSM 1495 / CBS 144.50 / IMI 039719) TaxID=759272 RepID=G0S8S6_CHATD|nr:hypothetical protein CTHT_0040180 [Thermochaetoides thermophila DSM 1495]EGS20279.1 hypothetical protein CTHT_0040180 [Thermochaetoides thermophila DSM 1495]
MAAPPDLGIPPSPHTVDVSIIDTGATIRGAPVRLFLTPPIEGHDYLAAPIYSFLIQHRTLDRTLVFDLGIRKDWKNLSPPLISLLNALGWTLRTKKDVREILDAGGIDTKRIEAVIWSHTHFDHTGDPSRFEPSTALIIGGKLPKGYPADPTSPILETDYTGRELIELDFATGNNGRYKPLQIGRFRALDYFADGSFYLIETPGHTAGHISALARVTPDPDPSFIFLAGDLFHHPGEIRPSRYLPIPSDIRPDPFAPDPHPVDCHYGCPGAIFDELQAQRGRSSVDTFYEPARMTGAESIHEDVDELLRTVNKLQDADAHKNVLVAAAHDESLAEVVEFFPKGKLNDFAQRGSVSRLRWRFLRDFAKAVGKMTHLLGPRREWGPVKGERDEEE